MNNPQGKLDSALVVYGGLVTEVNPSDLPAGAAPICSDMDFSIGSVKSRDGLQNVYTYCNLTSQDAATAFNSSGSGSAWGIPGTTIIFTGYANGFQAPISSVTLGTPENAYVATDPTGHIQVPYSISLGDTIICVATGTSGPNLSSLTDLYGTLYTPVGSRQVINGGWSQQIFIGVAGSGMVGQASNTFNFTATMGTGRFNFGLYFIHNVAALDQVDQAVSSSGILGTPTTLSSTGALFCVAYFPNPPLVNPTNAFAVENLFIVDGCGAGLAYASGSFAIPAGTYSPTYTYYTALNSQAAITNLSFHL